MVSNSLIAIPGRQRLSGCSSHLSVTIGRAQGQVALALRGMTAALVSPLSLARIRRCFLPVTFRGSLLPAPGVPSGPKLSHGCFFQAEDGIRDYKVTGVQTCALPI